MIARVPEFHDVDGVITWDEVALDLSPDVRYQLLLCLKPEVRGWYTAAEADADGGRFIETRRMQDVHGRFIRVGD